MEETDARYLAIQFWWLSSKATSEKAMHELELGRAFWHFQYHQWRGFIGNSVKMAVFQMPF